jgi:hypothetical protein
MPADVKAVVTESIAAIEKALSEKSVEVAQLKQELSVYENILKLLAKKDGHHRNGKPRNLGMVLVSMPATFTSKDFAAAAAFSGTSSVYLRQMLTRWTKQGTLKRLERGKYHKTKKASAEKLALRR